MRTYRLPLLILLCFAAVIRVGGIPAAHAQSSIPYLSGFPQTRLGGVDFGSPTVVDIDGDGSLDILVPDNDSCVWGYHADGTLLPNFPLMAFGDCYKRPRINSPIAVGNVDDDPEPEIAAGTRGVSDLPGELGKVFVWNPDGTLVDGWPQEMIWEPEKNDSFPEVYTVILADVAGTSALEIIAGTSNNASDGGDPKVDNPLNLLVWDGSGTMLPGFPVGHRTPGIYGHLGAANLIGDDYAEIIVPRDQPRMSVYDATAFEIPGWPSRSYVVEDETDFSTDPYVVFTRGAPAIADLNRDGIPEIAVAGRVKEPLLSYETTTNGLLVWEPDGNRAPGWDTAQRSGLLQTKNFASNNGIAIADLDQDGMLDIIANFFDGTIRAYAHDATPMWTFNFSQGRNLMASEPVIGDITGDGQLNVVFGVYSPDYQHNEAGGVYALDAAGNLLPDFPLQLTHEGSSSKQGIRAAPTLTDLDGDCTLEIAAASWAGSLYVWDLDVPYIESRLPWPTGRQNIRRDGQMPIMKPASGEYRLFLPILMGTGCIPVEYAP